MVLILERHGKLGKRSSTTADAVVGFVQCGFRDEDSVAKDTEKLEYPVGWRECTSKAALAAARKLVMEGPDTCSVGRFEVESACLYQALVERRGAKFGAAQKFLIGDLIGGFLTHHPADGNSLPGLKKCMQKLPSTGDPTKSLWDVATAAWAGSANTWPFMQWNGPKQRDMFDKKQCRPGTWTSTGDSVASRRAVKHHEGPFKDDEMGLTNYSDVGGSSPSAFKPGVVRQRKGLNWLERQRTQIGRIKKARSAQPYPEDHPWSLLDDNMVMVEPCNAASALSYLGLATNLCEMMGGPERATPAHKHFRFARDAASVSAFLAFGNHNFHG
eukprot:g5595.t1